MKGILFLTKKKMVMITPSSITLACGNKLYHAVVLNLFGNQRRSSLRCTIAIEARFVEVNIEIIWIKKQLTDKTVRKHMNDNSYIKKFPAQIGNHE